jgi:hypothetical protein
VSSIQINLSWTASTDNVGVTGYRVERCQGVSCTSFAQIGTPTTASYSDSALAASTSYSYRVRATDAAGNLSVYSSTVSGITQSGGSTSPPTITSPASGAVVTAGQSLTITVSVTSGAYPNGIAIIGHDPLGTTAVQSVTGSSVSFSLPIPTNTPPGTYAVTAVGVNSSGTLVSSSPIAVDVERADQPTNLIVAPSLFTFVNIGDTRAVTVLAFFTGGSPLDVTRSLQLTISSGNSAIATVQNGVVTAVAAGQTYLDVKYAQIDLIIPLTVQ